MHKPYPSFLPIFILSLCAFFRLIQIRLTGLNNRASRNPTRISTLCFARDYWAVEDGGGKDVRRFPGLEVVIGFNNSCPAISHNVNLRPFSVWRGPGLPLAN